MIMVLHKKIDPIVAGCVDIMYRRIQAKRSFLLSTHFGVPRKEKIDCRRNIKTKHQQENEPKSILLTTTFASSWTMINTLYNHNPFQ